MVESLFNKYKAIDLPLPPPPSTTVKQSQRGLGVYYSSVSKVHIIPIRNWDGSPATMFKKKKATKAVQGRQRDRWNPGVCEPARQAQLSSPRSLWENLSQQNRSKQQNKATRWIMPEEWHLSLTSSPMYTHLHTHEDKTKQNSTPTHNWW